MNFQYSNGVISFAVTLCCILLSWIILHRSSASAVIPTKLEGGRKLRQAAILLTVATVVALCARASKGKFVSSDLLALLLPVTGIVVTEVIIRVRKTD